MSANGLNFLLVVDEILEQKIKDHLQEDEDLSCNTFTLHPSHDIQSFLRQKNIDIAIIDYDLLNGNVVEVLNQAEKTPCIFISQQNNIPLVVDIIKAGGFDFIVKDEKNEFIRKIPSIIHKALRVKNLHQLPDVRSRTTDLKRSNEKLLEKLGELALMQNALREANLFSQEIINGAGDGIIVYDRNLCYVVWNPLISEILGVSSEEVLGKNALELFPYLVEQGIDKILYRVLAGESHINVEFVFRIAKNNKSGWLSATYVPHHDSDGNVIGVIATMREITERKRVEEDLRKNEEKYRELYAAAQRQAQEMVLLDRVRMAVAKELDLKTVYFIVVEEIAKAFGYPLISLFLREGENLVLQHQVGYSTIFDRIPVDRGITGRVTRTGRPVFLENARQDPDFLEAVPGIESEICVPLFEGNSTVGILNIEGDQHKRLNQADFQLMLALSEHINIAIGRAWLYTKARASEERYRSLIEVMPDAVLVIRDEKVILINSAGLTLWGAKSDNELIGKSIFELIHHDYHLTSRERILYVLEEDKITNLNEGKIIDVNGKEIDIEEIVIPFKESEGKAVLMIFRDVTGLIETETAWHESERRMSTLISNLPGIVYRCKNDRNWTMEFISAGCFDLTGYTVDHLVNNFKVSFNDLIVIEDRQQVWNSIQASIARKESYELNYRIRTADGKFKWVWEKGQGIFSKDGALIALEGFITDITERLQRERELGTLASVSAALRAARTHSEMFPIILDQMVKLLNADSATLELIDTASGDAIIQLGYGSMANLTGYRIPYDQGLNYYIRTTGKPYLNNDVKNDPMILTPEKYIDINANAGAPMIAEGRLLGFLWLGRRTYILESEVRPLVAIADIAANAIHRSMLHEQTERRLEQLSALRKVDTVISSSPDLHIILNTILDQVMTYLMSDAADILLLDPDLFSLELAARQGFHTNFIEQKNFYISESFAGKAVLSQKVIQIPDVSETKAPARILEAMNDEGFVSYYSVPLIAKGQVKGVLEVYLRKKFSPDLEWLNFFEALGGQAAIAIDNVELFRGIQKSNIELALAYDATIEGWSKALDLRDKETEGHTLRVVDNTLKLARTMGISEGELVHIRRGALLHDIGKMGVPDSILLKPGPLTPDEWAIMRKHPIYAYEMLSPIRYLHSALDIPYCHHEKWDGTGYPRGLKNEQIPLSARIFAIIDVWDAITSDRPYRRAWSKEKAIDYIRSESGKQFAPNIVNAFLNVIASE